METTKAMASKKEEKMDEIIDCLEGVMDRLEDISDGLEELNMTLGTIGFMHLADRLSENRPELKEKMEPLMQTWIEAMEEGSPLREVDEEEDEEDEEEED
ncbi:MAG: hypothetical protein JW986_00030 [Methanotrichaceae archaeon]|nr:hypothetical protein [Methanotrichaceae archaeon]